MTLLMSSCAVQQVTRSAQYPKMYEERPLAIAVMPPINQTNHVEAKDYFYTTLYAPLCEKGYYVYSPMQNNSLKQIYHNSVMSLEQMLQCLPLSNHGKETKLVEN